MGVISSLGNSEKEILQNIQTGSAVFSRPSFDPDVVIAPIKDFDLKPFCGRFKDRRYLTRGNQFAMAAAVLAIQDSGVKTRQLAETGLFLGTGPNLDIGNEIPHIADGTMNCKDGLMALWMLRFLPNTAASAISEFFGIHGENLTINTACAASLQAVGEAFRKIKNGYLNMALAGGGDSRLNPGAILAYKKANALFTGDGLPRHSSRPFDCQRKGFVPGEGGAVFVLEELSHAQRRGAKIYTEICGYGCSMDGHNMTAPSPTAEWAEKAVRSALMDAGLKPDDIHLVSSHGTGTPLNDEAEALLLDRVFGRQRPFVIALKSWIGHIAAACGASELALTLACLKNGFLPEIQNLNQPCHDRVNFVRESTRYAANTVLFENFGFGGQNAALIIRKH